MWESDEEGAPPLTPAQRERREKRALVLSRMLDEAVRHLATIQDDDPDLPELIERTRALREWLERRTRQDDPRRATNEVA